MICRTLPANVPRLSAYALGTISGPPATPGKRLAALKCLLIPIHYGGNRNSVLHFHPKLAQPSCVLRLSDSTALSERLYCSLNLIEPHLGPDLRSTLPVDLGTPHGAFGCDPRNLYTLSSDSGIWNPRYYSQSSSGKSNPAGTPTANSKPLSPRNNMILRLAVKKCNH
jgi:hypothetical protein